MLRRALQVAHRLTDPANELLSRGLEMPDLETISANLRRLPKDIDDQLEQTGSSSTVTAELAEKIAELKRRAEKTAVEEPESPL